MLDLKLREEFLGDNMPGTTIAFHNGNAQGATEKTPEEFLKITYPTSDLIKALRSLRTDRNGGPVVLIGGRGKGKSHLMAVLHHAVKTPNVTQQWLSDWSETLQDSSLENFPLCQGYLPITETVSDNEYLNLWDLLFERHPKGDYYKGQFEASRQHIPSRTLIENMLAEQPICMILDEFQTWYDALPIENQGFRVKDSAFSFVQTLSEISRDKPSILMLIVSVRDNTSDAFRQLHRQDPLLIDFNGETARKDRRNLILYRLFENRLNIPKEKIEAITSSYAAERFRLIYQPAGTTNPQKISDEVTDNWPFAPELITLLEDQILMTPAAQETRDMIRILAKSFRAHNTNIPIITSAHFPVDGDASQVQSLVDSIAQDAGQERLRDIARRNFSAIKESGVAISYSAEMVSTIWMYSMAPGNTRGVKTPLLQLSLSAGSKIDDNVFNQSLMHLVENSINIHSDSSNSKFWFEQTKNPNTEVRVTAKNDNLWSVNANPGNPATHPEKDILWLRKTIRNCFTSQRREAPSQIIVLGPQWDTNPWEEVAEQERPSKWTRPVLLVIPAAFRDNQSRNSTLGKWLATQVPSRRNTVRFLIQDGEKNIFIDKELLFLSRCSYLCSNAA